MRNNPLKVEIVDNELRISLGVGTLAHAVEHGHPLRTIEDAEIIDDDQLARDIVRELEWSEEDGTTAVHRMLDAAAYAAFENGSEGFAFED